MDDNEKDSILIRIAALESSIETCTANVEEGEAKAKAFRAKRTRCKQELATLKRRLGTELE